MKRNLLLSLPLLLASCSGTETVRGIARTYMNASGELIIVYTDGTEENVGLVKGSDGRDGMDGKDGIDGEDGSNGVDGKDGESGTNGVDGQNGTDGKNAENYYIWETKTEYITVTFNRSDGSYNYINVLSLIDNPYITLKDCHLNTYSCNITGTIHLSDMVKDVTKITFRYDKYVDNYARQQNYWKLPDFPISDGNGYTYASDVTYTDWSLIPNWTYDGNYFYQTINMTELYWFTSNITEYNNNQVIVEGTFLTLIK